MFNSPTLGISLPDARAYLCRAAPNLLPSQSEHRTSFAMTGIDQRCKSALQLLSSACRMRDKLSYHAGHRLPVRHMFLRLATVKQERRNITDPDKYIC